MAPMTQYPNVHPGTNGTSASRTAATTNLSEKEFVTRLQETADLHGARRPAQRFSAEELTNALQAFQTASVEQTGTLPLGTIQHVFSLPDAQVVSLAWSPNEKRLALVH